MFYFRSLRRYVINFSKSPLFCRLRSKLLFIQPNLLLILVGSFVQKNWISEALPFLSQRCFYRPYNAPMSCEHGRRGRPLRTAPEGTSATLVRSFDSPSMQG